MADIYLLLLEEHVFSGHEPLSSIGTPLICPGMYLRSPPMLPPRSLLIISDCIPAHVATSAYIRIPELMGIVSHAHEIPGPGDVTRRQECTIHEGTVLCGCDVRADIFLSGKGPVEIIKKQAMMHIEFPKGIDPKIVGVEEQIRRLHPHLVIDACAGPGTLGITAALYGISHIVMVDVWYASIWSAIRTIHLNQKRLGISTIHIHEDIEKRPKVWAKEPVTICTATGAGITIEVCHGSYEFLENEFCEEKRLTLFDPFDKKSFQKNDQFLSVWREKIGGEVFIP